RGTAGRPLAGGRPAGDRLNIAILHARRPARRIVSCMTKASLLRAEEGLPRGVQGAADSRFSNVVRVFAGLFPGRRFGGGPFRCTSTGARSSTCGRAGPTV